ncbi:DUF1156 domain-containing protein [Nocardioides ginkgobilobae]
MHKRKLIEVALPLEAINRESAREKSIRHGHPSTMHIWWARRPLAAARAVLFAQLVDDPSARPDRFPTEELQREERERLHTLIAELCAWESGRNDRLLDAARREILASTGGNPPPILDPFAGGGAIPVEAQRLGLESRAADLNPVAVLLNKALIELPPAFVGTEPVWPGLAASQIRKWVGAEGLAADVRAYGEWIGQQAKAKVGDLYPDVRLDDASHVPALAWIWARTLTCPNPACGIEMPLVRSWWLSKKRGGEAYVAPHVETSNDHPSGRRVRFEIIRSKVGAPSAASDGTVGRSGATCVACDAPVSLEHIRSTSRSVGLGQQLMAAVATKNRRRFYVEATADQELAANVELPEDLPLGELSDWPGRINVYRYGLTKFIDLFTPRQLRALIAFSDLVLAAREKVIEDGGSAAYADAIATYLGLCASKMTVFHTSLSRWRSDADKTAPAFGRQAIAMVWDFAEPMPFAGAGGDWDGVVDGAAKTLEGLRPGASGTAIQAPAQSVELPPGVVISTDPPYYDNISYAELSDYFYVWLRRVLRPVYPDLLSTLLVPKAEELVANPYRHNGPVAAKKFFEDGFREVFARARATASAEYPITVYYAFKQSDSDDVGEASSGWETLLEGMITAGWEITSTWPMRTEGGTRLIARDSNALASSIVLSLRPRPDGGPTTDRRGFIAALEAELPGALRKLQQGQVAPVDLPQAAIGPGMAVFSRYAAVLEPTGSKMTVRAALARINEILDQVLNEQEGDFDSTSRFAIAWYRQHGYGVGKFGDADSLARARNTSVDTMDRDEILTSRAGNVQLIKPADLPWDYDVLKDAHTSNWEALHHLIKVLERDGIAPAGDFLQSALTRPDGAVDADLVKELAHLLFRIAEGNGWTKDALSFNTLVTTWPEILEVARSVKKPTAQQGAFDFDEGDD